MSVSITFYDGTDCIGGNKILLEDNGAALMLDFGTNFKAEGMYFDEFLNSRNTFGFSDLLALKILPPLKNLYRLDLEYPGVWQKYLNHPLFREVEIQGVLLSHAHYDHCGYISYLRDDIPVYSSLTTALICKALQDTSGGNRLQDICYTTPREFKDGLIQTVRSTKTNPAPAQQRPYRVFGQTAESQAVVSFWEQCDATRGLCCTPLEACVDKTEVAGLQICFWPVDHSVPGAGAFGIKTSASWIVYTGDLRLHGKNSALSRQFIKEAAELKPAVLICEGTHPATESPVTEDTVASNCFDAVRKTDGLVVADFGPRNVERLLSFWKIAGAAGRQLVLTPKDVYLLDAIKAGGETGIPDPFTDERIALYVRPKAVRQKWEDALLSRFNTSAPDRLVDAARVQTDPSAYILCFSYYDFHAFLDIAPSGGSYIYSSSEAFDEEMLIDHQRVKNWIDFCGFRLYGTLGRDREKSGFHASGHIHGPGLEELVQMIKPEILIPIHSENRSFFKRFEGSLKVLYPSRGDTVRL
ncbi:MAG: exonuclease [Firmicutes bacterium]|nr:exonuclease [Bacillota bacterium]